MRAGADAELQERACLMKVTFAERVCGLRDKGQVDPLCIRSRKSVVDLVGGPVHVVRLIDDERDRLPNQDPSHVAFAGTVRERRYSADQQDDHGNERDQRGLTWRDQGARRLHAHQLRIVSSRAGRHPGKLRWGSTGNYVAEGSR